MLFRAAKLNIIRLSRDFSGLCFVLCKSNKKRRIEINDASWVFLLWVIAFRFSLKREFLRLCYQ